MCCGYWGRFLSRRDGGYTGGEFLLVEQRPRAQSRGEAIATEQGEVIILGNVTTVLLPSA